MPALHRTLLVLLAALLVAPLGACGDQPDHYARALAVERELHRQVPDAGYDHRRYIAVLRELREVPRAGKDRARADVFARKIRDGRRVAAAKKFPQVASLPGRLEARAAAPTPAPSSPPSAPYTVRVTMQMIIGDDAMRVKLRAL